MTRGFAPTFDHTFLNSQRTEKLCALCALYVHSARLKACTEQSEVTSLCGEILFRGDNSKFQKETNKDGRQLTLHTLNQLDVCSKPVIY
jgi:hypothetical protein